MHTADDLTWEAASSIARPSACSSCSPRWRHLATKSALRAAPTAPVAPTEGLEWCTGRRDSRMGSSAARMSARREVRVVERSRAQLLAGSEHNQTCCPAARVQHSAEAGAGAGGVSCACACPCHDNELSTQRLARALCCSQQGIKGCLVQGRHCRQVAPGDEQAGGARGSASLQV